MKTNVCVFQTVYSAAILELTYTRLWEKTVKNAFFPLSYEVYLERKEFALVSTLLVHMKANKKNLSCLPVKK